MAEYLDEYKYRIYVTESLRLQGEGRYMSAKYTELIGLEGEKDTRTAEEVAEDIIARHGLKVVG